MGIPQTFGRAFLDWFAERVGASWRGSMTEDEVAEAEIRWGIRFSPDYRLLLRRLGDGSPLYDWRTDTKRLQNMFAWLWEGLQFDVEHNVLWLPSWGPKPATLDAQKERVRELVEAAPKLIPIYGHRYLLAEPCVAGNPVLSVHQSDIIVYGHDLRSYLLNEFSKKLGLDEQMVRADREAAATRRNARYAEIRFWGELLEGDF